MPNRIIFQKSDFILCGVPVPVGYPQSLTHAGIASYKGHFYLTCSPFPSYRNSRYVSYIREFLKRLSLGRLCNRKAGESFENPLLYYGVTKNNEPATDFYLMQQRPLMEAPEPYFGLPAFNSDPDIFIEGDTIYVLNRAIFRTELRPGELLNKYIIRLYLISGKIDGNKFKFERNILFKESESIFVSPCITHYNNDYLLTYLDTASYIDGKTFKGLYLMKSNTIDGLKNEENWNKVSIQVNGYTPWHMSVFQHYDKLYSIVACVKKYTGHFCWQMLGEFTDDLSCLKIYNTPLTDYNSYRGAACVRDDGEFVLYSTTVHEKIKGSKAVDGRDIIMAHMPFGDLLRMLKEQEQ